MRPSFARPWRSGETAILVTVARAEGSTPRETGATMLVTRVRAHGTIGGGQLEFHAIDVAREMIAEGTRESGSTCRSARILANAAADAWSFSCVRRSRDARGALARGREARPKPHLMCCSSAPGMWASRSRARSLPCRSRSRFSMTARALLRPCRERSHSSASTILKRRSSKRPPGSAFVVLTHSHALDYRLADAALRRDDARYVGMIGSATKRARFERWFLARGGAKEALGRFICPIGGKSVRDKRPAVIAALATAEILAHLLVPARRIARLTK